MTTYSSAPAMTCSAPAKSFSRCLDAHRHASESAALHRVGYCVYNVSAGRLKWLAAYSPNPTRA